MPGKNIRLLNGKPLIAWTLDSIKSSKFVDKTFISTDNTEIAEVCETYGIEVPELRPVELARDESTSVDVILYTLSLLEKRGEIYDYLILLEPTSPLRREEDIDRMIKLSVEHPDADGVISLGRVHQEHPSIIKKVNDNGYIVPYVAGLVQTDQRQKEDEAYFPYGVGYLIKAERFREMRTFYTDRMLPYYIERWQNYEVDDIYDFNCIEMIIRMEEWL